MAEKVQKALACGHTVTLSGTLKMGDYRKWVRAEREGDIETTYHFMAKMITEWDWSGMDPAKLESYDELVLAEYRQIVEAIRDYVLAEATAKN